MEASESEMMDPPIPPPPPPPPPGAVSPITITGDDDDDDEEENRSLSSSTDTNNNNNSSSISNHNVNDDEAEEVVTECGSEVTNPSRTITTTTATSRSNGKKPLHAQQTQAGLSSQRTKWRKPHDKPHHPRTGYNLFFQFERERILQQMDDRPIVYEDVQNLQVSIGPRTTTTTTATTTKSSSNSNSNKKMKLGFAELARNIATKWKNLDGTIKELFEEKAIEDRVRYKRQLELWNDHKKQHDTMTNTNHSNTTTTSSSSSNNGQRNHNTLESNRRHSIPGNTTMMINQVDQQHFNVPSIHPSHPQDILMRNELYHIHNQEQERMIQYNNHLHHDQIRNGHNHSPYENSVTSGTTTATIGTSARSIVTPHHSHSHVSSNIISPPESMMKSRPLTTTSSFHPKSETTMYHRNEYSSTIEHFMQHVACLQQQMEDFVLTNSTIDSSSSSCASTSGNSVLCDHPEILQQIAICTNNIRRLSIQLEILSQQQEQMPRSSSNAIMNHPNVTSFDVPSLMNDVRRTMEYTDTDIAATNHEFDIDKKYWQQQLMLHRHDRKMVLSNTLMMEQQQQQQYHHDGMVPSTSSIAAGCRHHPKYMRRNSDSVITHQYMHQQQQQPSRAVSSRMVPGMIRSNNDKLNLDMHCLEQQLYDSKTDVDGNYSSSYMGTQFQEYPDVGNHMDSDTIRHRRYMQMRRCQSDSPGLRLNPNGLGTNNGRMMIPGHVNSNEQCGNKSLLPYTTTPIINVNAGVQDNQGNLIMMNNHSGEKQHRHRHHHGLQQQLRPQNEANTMLESITDLYDDAGSEFGNFDCDSNFDMESMFS